MTTEKQLAANRRNAMKSTGPRTAQGKARASQNALKLGLLAQGVVVRGRVAQESSKEYSELCREFQERLAPVGLLEEMLTGQIVATAWRLRRARKAEAGEIALSVDEGEWERKQNRSEEIYSRLVGMGDPVPGMEGSAPGNAVLTKWLLAVRAAVEKEGVLTDAAVKILCGGRPNGHSRLLEDIRRRFPSCPEGMDAGKYRDYVKRRTLAQIDAMIDRQQQLQAECERRKRMEERARQAAAALPEEAALGRIVRYESALEKQLFRAMNQLERLQARRLRHEGMAEVRVSDGQEPAKLKAASVQQLTLNIQRPTFNIGLPGTKRAADEILQNEPILESSESPDFMRVKD